MFWKNRLAVSIAAAGVVSAAVVGGVAAASGGGTSAVATVAVSEAPAGESGVVARADLASLRVGGGGVAIALNEDGDGPRGRCGQRGHAGGEEAEFLGVEPEELRERLQGGETPARVLGAVAEIIGVEPQAVIEGVQNGETIAEIAAANGSSGEAVVEALVARTQERLDAAAAAGRIPAEEAAEKLAEATERINRLVFETPQPGEGPGAAPAGAATTASDL